MQIHMQRFNASSSDTSDAQGKYLKKYYVWYTKGVPWAFKSDAEGS